MLLRSKGTFTMNTHRLKKGFLIATYRTFGSSKSRHAGESAQVGEKDDHCIEGHVSYVDQIAIPGLLFIKQ